MDRALPTSAHETRTPGARPTGLTLRVRLGRTIALAMVAAVTVVNPAAADGHLGLLFNNGYDITLPTPVLAPQLTNNPDANDGWVHFPFSAGDTRTLLSGETFNGPASLPDGRRLTVGTGYSVPGYDSQIVFYDRMVFGLSPDGTQAACDYSALTVESGDTPSSVRSAAVTMVIGDFQSPGAKLGYVRLLPDASTAGKWLCMYREMQIIEARNASPKYYDAQRSQVVMTDVWINIGFEGSRSDPARVEAEEAEEPEPAAEPEPAEEPEAEAEAAEEPEAEEAAAEETAEAEAEEAADEASDDATAEATADDSAADAAGDAAVTAAAEESDAGVGGDGSDAGDADDDAGDGVPLTTVLLGLIALLLAGLLVMLVRNRRKEEAAPVAASVAGDQGEGDDQV